MPLAVLRTDDIHALLVRRIDHQKQAVGIVVGVLEPAGRRIVAHGHLAKGDPRTLDGDTIFEIGSVSKVFTSLVLAEMVHRNEVALDDPASRYLPEHVRMPERSGKAITLLDLSTHRSGLPRLPHNLDLNPRTSHAAYSVDDVYQFLSGYALPRDPGSEYEYSNLGAGLLGHLLAQRGGTDYEGLIRSRITRPLGMPDTAIMPTVAMSQRMATGHDAMLAPAGSSDLPTPLAGAGALRSSANDMLTFLEAFLGYKESPLAPAMKAMLEVRRPAGQAMIGLGWITMSGHGGEIIWHNGATRGFHSFVGYAPKERIGVVVLANASTRVGIDDIGLHLLNPDAPLANPVPPKQRTEIHIDPKLLDHYTGRYQVTPNLIFEITRDGERLFAQGFARLPHNRPGDLTGLPKFELLAEGEQHFFTKVSDSLITFETGPDGRATSLILRKAGRDMPGTRLS